MLPDGVTYEITDKARVRAIWNHFNPFARRVSWAGLCISAVAGSLLPLFAIFVGARIVGEQVRDVPPPVAMLAKLVVVAAFYCVAGLIIGAATDWSPFHWIMLISYLPAHMAAGWSFGWFPYSTLMFVVAFSTRQAKRRKNLIFESGPE